MEQHQALLYIPTWINDADIAPAIAAVRETASVTVTLRGDKILVRSHSVSPSANVVEYCANEDDDGFFGNAAYSLMYCTCGLSMIVRAECCGLRTGTSLTRIRTRMYTEIERAMNGDSV